jgi:hypothetical protein
LQQKSCGKSINTAATDKGLVCERNEDSCGLTRLGQYSIKNGKTDTQHQGIGKKRVEMDW